MNHQLLILQDANFLVHFHSPNLQWHPYLLPSTTIRDLPHLFAETELNVRYAVIITIQLTSVVAAMNLAIKPPFHKPIM